MKTSFWNPDNVHEGIMGFPKLREKIYGRALMNTPAVKALEEFYHCLALSDGPEKLFELVDAEKTEDMGSIKVVHQLKVLRREAAIALRPFQQSLCNDDTELSARFFTQLGDAISRRSRPRFQAALFLAGYIADQKYKLTLRTRTKPISSRELEKKMLAKKLGGNLSNILREDLGINLNAWPFEKLQPGRKPKRASI